VWAGLVGVTVTVAHLPSFFHRLLDGDEAIYGSIAALLNTGASLYGPGGVDNKPPGIFWVYAAAFRVGGNYDMTAVKIDHRFSNAYSTFFRVNKGKGLLVFPFDFNGIAAQGRNIVNRPNFGVSWGNTVLISPHTTFDIRLGYARGKEDNAPWSGGPDGRYLCTATPVLVKRVSLLSNAVGTVPSPCVTDTWVTGALRVMSGGIPLLLQDSQSVCAPNGTPSMVT